MVLKDTFLCVDLSQSQRVNTITTHRPIRLKRNSAIGMDFYHVKDLSSVGYIKIMFEIGGTLEAIDVPEVILSNLAQYIRKREELDYQSNYKFDCYDFVHYLSGLEYSKKKFNHSDWQISSDLSKIMPGDTILICNTIDGQYSNFMVGEGQSVENSNFHFAIYLGHGLYVSKFERGNIYITSLEELRSKYDYDNIFRLTPKTIDLHRTQFGEKLLASIN